MNISPIIANYWPQKEGLQGLYEHIEMAGRTCYESTDKMVVVDGVSTTAEAFCNRLLKVLKHQSVAEHASIYLMAEETPLEVLESPYTIVRGEYVTTNYRVLLETGYEHLAEHSKFTNHEPRLTFEILCGIDISREIIRHRSMSPTERSTRYVDMSDLSISKPEWIDMSNLTMADEVFMDAMEYAQEAYTTLLSLGWAKEQARKVLPLATETRIWVTGSLSQWNTVLDLRLHNKSGKAHPDIQEVSRQIAEYIKMYFGE